MRIEKTLEEAQTVEQAGFRKGYSTVEHIFTLQQIIEKCYEYDKFDVYIMFIDFSKAFDSVEYNALFNALQEQGVHSALIEVLRVIYRVGKSSVKVNESKVPIQIERGVRQGDTISPRLFTACLRRVFSELPWAEKGIKVNGRSFSHLLFADDIVLFAKTKPELEAMVQE